MHHLNGLLRGVGKLMISFYGSLGALGGQDSEAGHPLGCFVLCTQQVPAGPRPHLDPHPRPQACLGGQTAPGTGVRGPGSVRFCRLQIRTGFDGCWEGMEWSTDGPEQSPALGLGS